MSLATWLLSNFTTQTAPAYKATIDANFAVAQRIVDKFAARQSTTPAMTVTLDAGALYDGQNLTEKAAQTIGTITAPVANPRIDRIVINKTSGVVSIITGTENATPAAPALTVGVFPVAQVLLQTSTLSIVNSMITDERATFASNQSGEPINAVGGIKRNGVLLVSDIVPVIASGFGTSPNISHTNGSLSFMLYVGTGGVASSGVITMPASAFDWNCFVSDLTIGANMMTRMSARTTTSITLTNILLSTGAATPWPSGSYLLVTCIPS